MASCFTLGFHFPQGISRMKLFFISLFHQHFAEMSPIDKWDKSKKTLEIAVLCRVNMLNNPGEAI